MAKKPGSMDPRLNVEKAGLNTTDWSAPEARMLIQNICTARYARDSHAPVVVISLSRFPRVSRAPG